MVCVDDKWLGLFSIDAGPEAKDTDNAYADIEELGSKPVIAEVEASKDDVETNNDIETPDESPKSEPKNDSSSNSKSKDTKESMDFNDKKIENKVTQRSAHNAKKVKTEQAGSLKESAETSAANLHTSIGPDWINFYVAWHTYHTRLIDNARLLWNWPS